MKKETGDGAWVCVNLIQRYVPGLTVSFYFTCPRPSNCKSGFFPLTINNLAAGVVIFAYHKTVASLPVFQKANKRCYLIPVGNSIFHSEISKFDSEISKSHSDFLKFHCDFLKFDCEILISSAGSLP